jgi:hypothetical protein
MTSWITKFRTALALGLPNIARAAGYRLGLHLGVNPVCRLRGLVPNAPFFSASRMGALPLPVVSDWQNSARIFSRWPLLLSDSPPDWLANPLTGQRISAPERLWWQIPDFDPAFGDIKLIWELSRMDWVLALSQRVRQGEDGALDRLNTWMVDWCRHNPPFQGPNWKCGQEASIRVMHIAVAAMLLGQVSTVLPGLRELIKLHLRRIAPTVHYAMAQDNNHGMSEAAALFIGGSWLELLGDEPGARWAVTGRRLLENRVHRLIDAQGTFSQYSLNYHRLMIDTLSIAECWRRHLDLPVFSITLRDRAMAAAKWLLALIDPDTGDGPNVGANDGARLLQLTNSSYRDYRPSVQLAMVLFGGKRAYERQGTWDHAARWLGVEFTDAVTPKPGSLQADHGGFVVMRLGKAMALLRYPRFRFRPSQADALHLDLWVNGKARLRDAGTYSYNSDPQLLTYFGGVSGHNTVQFDQREQMPRLGRFLLGDWLCTEKFEPMFTNQDSVWVGAGYCDGEGARHHRRVQLKDGQLFVHDQLQGFKFKAVLRWRLSPQEWLLDKPVGMGDQSFRCTCNHDGHVLTVSSNVQIERCEVVQGWESLHYLEKTPVPVLELEIAQPGTLTTRYQWTP